MIDHTSMNNPVPNMLEITDAKGNIFPALHAREMVVGVLGSSPTELTAMTLALRMNAGDNQSPGIFITLTKSQLLDLLTTFKEISEGLVDIGPNDNLI